MKFLFDDETFSFETLRSAAFAAYGGADLGEVLTTASHIRESDEVSWHKAWKATARRVAEIGEQVLATSRSPLTTRRAPSSHRSPRTSSPSARGRTTWVYERGCRAEFDEAKTL
jgi:hypothetical protein